MLDTISLAFLGVLAVTIAGFAARPWLRGLYAPPHGGGLLAITWIVALPLAIYGFSLGGRNTLLGLGLFCGAPFAALSSAILWRDAVNRSRGRSPQYMTIPEPLTTPWRVGFGVASIASGALAVSALTIPPDPKWELVVGVGAAAIGFARASATARIPSWLRARLGLTCSSRATLPPGAGPPEPPVGAV